MTTALQYHLDKTVGHVGPIVFTTSRKLAFALIAACALAPIPMLVSGPYDSRHLAMAVLLGVSVIVSETLLNEQWRGARLDAMHPGWAFFTAALMFEPGPWIVAGAVLSGVFTMASWRQDRLAAAWVAVRSASLATLAVWMTNLIDQPVVGAVIASIVGYALQVASVVLTDPADAPTFGTRELWFRTVYNILLVVAVGAVGAYLLASSVLWLPAVVLFAAAAGREYTAHRADISEAEIFQALISYVRGREERGVLPAAELTLFAMESAFASERTNVTVTLLGEEQTWQLSRRADGTLARAAVTLTTAAVERIKMGSGATAVSTTSGEAVFSAVLGDSSQPLALVDVHWTGRPARNRRHHERLGRQLAALSTTWLSNAYATVRAERAESLAQDASGDMATIIRLSDRTRPALDSLRAATQRVAVLSQTDQAGKVDDIVDELDRAAGALASLLGAVTVVGNGSSSDAVELNAADLPEGALRPAGAPAHVAFGSLAVHRG